jgi:NADPH:quinone reductase-like Zn-dependent oxidoreductase
MQALSFSQTGDLSALALVERPTPMPADGEVLVEIKAAGLNPSDVKNVLGFFPAYTTPPRIPGRDFAGVVRQGPPDMVGKRVFGTGLGLGFSQDGTHAQFLTLPAAGCAEIPETLSFAQAAASGQKLSRHRRQWRGRTRRHRPWPRFGRESRRRRAPPRTGGGVARTRL